jgi:hypothetical protein
MAFCGAIGWGELRISRLLPRHYVAHACATLPWVFAHPPETVWMEHPLPPGKSPSRPSVPDAPPPGRVGIAPGDHRTVIS